MKLLRMLTWSLRLDRQLLFQVHGLLLSWKLALILQKYLHFLIGGTAGARHDVKSLMAFGSPFCYNEPLGPASLQRVYCAGRNLREILPERPVVLDVGANIGQFNFFAAKYLNASRVVSIEPAPDSFKLLRQNALAAEDCICCAVSDREGELMFHVAEESTQLSSCLAQPGSGYRDSYPVSARTLDDLADEFYVDRVDLLKIDTEGNEYDVLQSAQRLLARTRFVLVEMSVFRECSGNLFRIGSLLEERGFRLAELSGGEGTHPRDLDGLFERR